MFPQTNLSALVRELCASIQGTPVEDIHAALVSANLYHHRATLEQIVREVPQLGSAEHAAEVCAGYQVDLLQRAAGMLPRMQAVVEGPNEPPMLRLALLAVVVYSAAPDDLIPDSLGPVGFVDDAILIHRCVGTLPPDALAYLGAEPVPDEYLMLLQLAVPTDIVPPLRQRVQAVGAQLAGAQFAGPMMAAMLVNQFLLPQNLAQFMAFAGDRRTELPPNLPPAHDPTGGWSSSIHSFPGGDGGFARTDSGWFIWE